MPRVQPPTSRLNELQREAFEILPGTVNVRCRTGIDHLFGLSQNIPVAGKAYFEDELAEEATWGSHHPHHVHFASSQKGGLTSTPLKSSVKIGEDNILLPQQRRARESLMNTTVCPPRYEIQMAVQEFCKMCKPKINKLKGWMFCHSQSNIPVMAQRHMGPCRRPKFITKRGHAADKRFYS